MNEPGQSGILTGLRWQLRSLWWQRSLLRLLAAGSAMASVVLFSLMGLFALDMLFDMDRLQRLVAIALLLACAAWCFRRLSWPLLARWEDRTELALLVEQGNRIDNDFVAALQFAGSEPPSGDSNQLRAAVIRRAAALAGQVRFSESVSYRRLGRRVSALLLAIAATAAVVLASPQHAGAFMNRLMFRAVDYPTTTSVLEIKVNTQIALDRTRGASNPRRVAIAEDRAVSFWILASGQVPPNGQIRITAATPGPPRNIELNAISLETRRQRLRDARAAIRRGLDGDAIPMSLRSDLSETLAADATGAALLLEGRELLSARQLRSALNEIEGALQALNVVPAQPSLFHGRLGRLATSISYQVALGDSKVDEAAVQMIPLPTVELAGQITPPPYTARSGRNTAPGTLQFSVLEGSAVTFQLRAFSKPLASAWMVIEREGGRLRTEFQPLGADGFEWSLAGTGLDAINQDLRFQVDVSDRDSLGLSRPLHGAIRVRRDETPTATLTSLHRVVVPTARPVLDYQVSDDFAVARIRLHARVFSSTDDSPGEAEYLGSEDSDRVAELDIPMPVETLTELPYHGKIPFNLAALSAVAGETVSISLEVFDDRGPAGGEAFRTDPLLLQVADEAAVLSSISELDQQTERRLSEIIQRQLEVRSTP